MINPAIENDLKNMSLNDVNYADYIKENYIQIPDNATNGDVISELFKNDPIDVFIHDVNIRGKYNVVAHFDREWWDKPYKADKEGD